MSILVLDNYDSFTFNLVKIIRDAGFGSMLTVARNDKITIRECAAFEKILISPGPGLPAEAGIMQNLILQLSPERNLLGICLGHQGIAEAFGARLFNLNPVLHGIVSKIKVLDTAELLFKDIPHEFAGGHYHSWSIDPESLSRDLTVTATNEKGLIMGIRHTTYQVRGLQFHPESIMTEYGEKIINNWLNE